MESFLRQQFCVFAENKPPLCCNVSEISETPARLSSICDVCAQLTYKIKNTTSVFFLGFEDQSYWTQKTDSGLTGGPATRRHPTETSTGHLSKGESESASRQYGTTCKPTQNLPLAPPSLLYHPADYLNLAQAGTKWPFWNRLSHSHYSEVQMSFWCGDSWDASLIGQSLRTSGLCGLRRSNCGSVEDFLFSTQLS